MSGMYSPRLSAAGFPMAPTQEEWDALSADERGEVTDAEMTPPELIARLKQALHEMEQHAEEEFVRRKEEERRRKNAEAEAARFKA